MGWGEAFTKPTKKEDKLVGANDVTRNHNEHATVAPIYLTTSPDNPNGRHVICSYTDRGGVKHIELFYIDKTRPIDQQLELISSVAGGGLFGDLKFIAALGSQEQ